MKKISQKRIDELNLLAKKAIEEIHQNYSGNFDLENNNTIQYIEELENHNEFQNITNEIINKPNINNDNKIPGIYKYFWDEQTQPYTSNLRVKIKDPSKPENDIFYSETEYQILCSQYRLLLSELIAKQILYNINTKQESTKIDDYYELTPENINLLKNKGFDFEKIKKHYESEINSFIESPIENEETKEEKEYNKYRIALIILSSITIVLIPIAIFIYFKITQKSKNNCGIELIKRNSFNEFDIKKIIKKEYDSLSKGTCEEILGSTDDQRIKEIVNKILAFFPKNVETINTNNLTDEQIKTLGLDDINYLNTKLCEENLVEDLKINIQSLLNTLPITIDTKLIKVSLTIISANPQAVKSAIQQKSFGLDINYDVGSSTIKNDKLTITISAHQDVIENPKNKNFMALFDEKIRENEITNAEITNAFINEFSPTITAKNASSKLYDIKEQDVTVSINSK